MLLTRVLSAVDRIAPPRRGHAHCDIPCGVYDPEQARIEAESCFKIIEMYNDNSDPLFRDRCVIVKEERAELCKHHISVLWSDYLKPEHVEKFPDAHQTFWKALKQCSTVKRSLDISEAKTLLDMIDDIDRVWKETGGPAKTRLAGRPG